MDIKVSITPEQIEQTVAKAIVDSSIGKNIEAAVEKALQDYSIQRSIDDVVAKFVREVIRDVLDKDQELRPMIRKIVAEKLTAEFVEKTFEKAIEKLSRDW